MEQQSFRTQLVEWMKEIIPYSNFDKYTRKVREGIETNIFNTDRHANHVTYIICTAEHRYSISATPTYLGCIASATRQRPGEDWTRGNDLPDGPFSRETWESIKDRIISYEMVKLDPLHELKGGVEGPPAVPSTPEETAYFEARHAVFLAQQALQRAERHMNGLDALDPEMPTTRSVAIANVEG